MDNFNSEKQVYEHMCQIKKKYGTYHKTLFHLHTPSSRDFRLYADWSHEDYVSADEDTLIRCCLQRGIVPDRKYLDERELTGDYSMYETKQEWLSFLLLADEIIHNMYEFVVVTDHNCITGINKLEQATNDIHKYRKTSTFPSIVRGIEVSCADRLHVVGIFDSRKCAEVQNWLDESLISVEDGTYKTSLEVIRFFKNDLGGVSYIAHINSSNLFDKGKFLSGAYKQQLRESGCFEYIGVHDKSNIETIRQLLKEHRIDTKGFVIDNDAHYIEGVGKNFFWIKCGKRSFKTLKEAFEDFEISVSITNKVVERKYIESILIENGGFLIGKDKKEFELSFSDSLNCFIGGRGTGKSTILQVIDYALGLRVADERILDFICEHGDIWILFADGKKEYLIKMANPTKPRIDDNILRCFGQNEDDIYRYKYYFREEKVQDYAINHYLSVYEICNDKAKNDINIKKVSKYKTLSKLYDVRYSVNELVQQAGNNQIDDFIRQLMFRDKTLSSPEKMINCRSRKGLMKAIQDMEELLKKRKQEVDNIIQPFNKKMKNTLRIIYRQDEPVDDPSFENWLFSRAKASAKKSFCNLDITEENAVQYLYYVCRKVGIVRLLKMSAGEEDRYLFDISDFFDKDRIDPADDEKKNAIDTIMDSLLDGDNLNQAIFVLRDLVRKSESLSLEFNINSKTTSRDGSDFRDVRSLSLGQKVVAMLDFVFGYGDHIGDNRPILIDQPEDNLDSQYIYKNLVKQLRNIKGKRQIIIATHSATIVTNAMADQVCVMNSDGKNGWVERSGYPSEDVIKKAIVNYMEGGIDSFKHKVKVYKPVLD